MRRTRFPPASTSAEQEMPSAGTIAPSDDTAPLAAPANASSRKTLLRLAIWGSLLLLAGFYEARCGFSALDIKRSIGAGCTVLRNAVVSAVGGEEAQICSRAHPSTAAVCLRPSSIASIAPRWLGLVVVQLGPVFVWVPLLAWLFLRLRQRGPHHPSSTSSSHHCRALAIHFAPVMVAAIGLFLALINIMRFALRLPTSWNPSRFDPSGHVFVFGLQLIPLWLLLDLKERLSSPAGTVGRELGRLEAIVFRLCIVIEVALWLLSLTTSAFFHTAAEVFAAFMAVALLALFCEKVVFSALLKLSSEVHGHHGLAKAAAPIGKKVLLAAVAIWGITAAGSYYLATGGVEGSTIRADLLPSHFGFDMVVMGIGAALVYQLVKIGDGEHLPAAATLPDAVSD